MKSTLGRVVLAAVVLGGFVFLGLFHEALDSPDRVRAYGGATGSWSRPRADWEKRNPIVERAKQAEWDFNEQRRREAIAGMKEELAKPKVLGVQVAKAEDDDKQLWPLTKKQKAELAAAKAEQKAERDAEAAKRLPLKPASGLELELQMLRDRISDLEAGR